MSDSLTLGLVMAFCAITNAAMVFATFWLNRGSAEGTINGKVVALEARVAAAEALAGKGLAELDMVRRDLGDCRVELAEKFTRVRTLVEVQITSLTQAETRFAAGLENMGERLRELTERFDRFLDKQA